MSGQQLGKPGAGDNEMNERPGPRHGSHRIPSSYHPDEKQAQAGAKRILFCETLELHSFPEGSRATGEGYGPREKGCLPLPWKCCRDPMIWAARVRATHHPQTRGSRSLCARCSFESQGQRRPFHCRGLLRRSCLHAARLVAPQRQVHGHLQDTTRPEAACLQPYLHRSPRICDQKGLLHAHPAHTVTLETLEVPP